MEILWDNLDSAAWRGTTPLQQSWEYGQAMAALGAGVRRAQVFLDGQEVARAQVLHRRGLRLILRGPLWLALPEPRARRAVLRRLARHAAPTIATPAEAVPGFGVLPLITPRHHALWDLTPDPAALRAGLSGKWRNRLVRAEAQVAPRRANPARALEPLLAAEEAQRGQRGYRALPPAFARLWPGSRQVWEWHSAGRMQAAMLILRHGTWASYHIGWAGPAARAAFAHGPMLWQAALALRAEGVRTFDLGDVNAEDAPGLAHFKLGTGAALTPLGPTALVLPG
ncbi:GNAT family N-acetyltransferase [Paracoccaceae bacterium Fryx2]|nr:GNAT family N-acetyltransferase [Paracoccaceae bacterium Fryx2]